jgi:hypothetical protein
MSNDKKFIDGLIVKAPNKNAPDYVIAKLSIKREELIAWLQAQTGDWINADIKESQGGKYYAAVDDWKPGTQRQEREPRREATAAAKPSASNFGADFADDDIPF